MLPDSATDPDSDGRPADIADDSVRRRNRRIRRGGLALLATLVLVTLGWLGITALLARAEVRATQHALARLESAIRRGDLAGATQDAGQVSKHAHRAYRLTTGPAWSAAAQVPRLGQPAVSVRGASAQADVLGEQVLTPLVSVLDGLEPARLIHGGSVQLQPLIKAAPVLSAASATIRTSLDRVDDLPHHTWLPFVDRARDTLRRDLRSLGGTVSTASKAADIVPTMLGSDGIKRYFVALQNEAEARGLGGLPGAFAIVTASRGTLSFTHFGNDSELRVSSGLDLGRDYDQRYAASDPTETYANSNISPDMSDAARIWAAMWQKHSGQQVDGAVALDPTAVGYLLRATGPVTVPDGTRVTADNAVALTESVVYRRFPDNDERKEYLRSIMQVASQKLLVSTGNTGLIRSAAKAADERRLLVWSADPSVEQVLAQTPLAGLLDAQGRPFSGFAVVNAAGSKLDYYLGRSIGYQRTGCGRTRRATATITLRNDAPASGLPAYVTIRSDKPTYPTRPGDNRVLLSYYATPGSQVRSITLDGKTVVAASVVENGLVVVTLDVELPRGTSRTLTVTLDEPAAQRAITVLRQPLARAPTVHVREDTCH